MTKSSDDDDVKEEHCLNNPRDFDLSSDADSTLDQSRCKPSSKVQKRLANEGFNSRTLCGDVFNATNACRVCIRNIINGKAGQVSSRGLLTYIRITYILS